MYLKSTVTYYTVFSIKRYTKCRSLTSLSKKTLVQDHILPYKSESCREPGARTSKGPWRMDLIVGTASRRWSMVFFAISMLSYLIYDITGPRSLPFSAFSRTFQRYASDSMTHVRGWENAYVSGRLRAAWTGSANGPGIHYSCVEIFTYYFAKEVPNQLHDKHSTRR